MSQSIPCSKTCTFQIVREEPYSSSYECRDCGTKDVVWKQHRSEYVHTAYYKKITPVKEIPDEYEGF
jgi:hypothetical protein